MVLKILCFYNLPREISICMKFMYQLFFITTSSTCCYSFLQNKIENLSSQKIVVSWVLSKGWETRARGGQVNTLQKWRCSIIWSRLIGCGSCLLTDTQQNHTGNIWTTIWGHSSVNQWITWSQISRNARTTIPACHSTQNRCLLNWVVWVIPRVKNNSMVV